MQCKMTTFSSSPVGKNDQSGIIKYSPKMWGHENIPVLVEIETAILVSHLEIKDIHTLCLEIPHPKECQHLENHLHGSTKRCPKKDL